MEHTVWAVCRRFWDQFGFIIFTARLERLLTRNSLPISICGTPRYLIDHLLHHWGEDLSPLSRLVGTDGNWGPATSGAYFPFLGIQEYRS